MTLHSKILALGVLLTICFTVIPSSGASDQPPKEENCRQAITAGLEQLRQIPPDTTQRDNEARKKLLADIEQLVESNRRQGVSECQTWSDMMKKAFNQ